MPSCISLDDAEERGGTRYEACRRFRPRSFSIVFSIVFSIPLTPKFSRASRRACTLSSSKPDSWTRFKATLRASRAGVFLILVLTRSGCSFRFF